MIGQSHRHVAAMCSLALLLCCCPALLSATTPAIGTEATTDIVPEEVARLILEGLRLPQVAGPVYLALRSDGLLLSEGWAEGHDWNRALVEALRSVPRKLQDSDPPVDALEVCLTYHYRSLSLKDERRARTNIHRGVRGIELRDGNRVQRLAPTTMLARNLSFDRAIEKFDAGDGLEIRFFDAYQYLVSLRPEPKAIRMMRGNRTVALGEVTAKRVRRAACEMGDWLVRQIHDDGRLTYKYWPSRGKESESNNMIRQFMATIALARYGAFRNDSTMVPLLDRNLSYNLDQFYKQEGQLGYIEYDGKAKLGAAALAALAIVEHPHRNQFAVQEAALRRFVRWLWRTDGSFRTFFKPWGASGNQNFYPGEALLLWAHLIRESADPELAFRYASSARYYRDWHSANRNPAFIPWHTQAAYLVWRESRDPFLADWIKEMNDWLLDVQQWSDMLYPDTRGRFYHPRKPYGPPHASSTGVYLEGLSDAFLLARETGDTVRAEQYRLAILRGIRSVLQLQFTDEIDMFYISKRDRVAGSLRTTVYHNEVRVDNVQHVLMALLKVLATFSPQDYRTSNEG